METSFLPLDQEEDKRSLCFHGDKAYNTCKYKLQTENVEKFVIKQFGPSLRTQGKVGLFVVFFEGDFNSTTLYLYCEIIKHGKCR